MFLKNFEILILFCVVYKVSAEARSRFTTTKIGPQPIWNSTHTDKLRQDLLLNYDKFARPAQHYNTTTVNFGFTIRHVEVNEVKSSLIVNSWLNLNWNDEKLKWDPSEYGGITDINLADHEIWQPDIFLYNSATSATTGHYSSTHCIVNEQGTVMWVPPAQFTVLCDLDLRYWPFDVQECELILGSWTYNGNQIDIVASYEEAVLELLVTNNEWSITKTSIVRESKVYPCCPGEHYVHVRVGITLARSSPSYKVLVVAPGIVITVLILASFWLPPQAGEKIILNSCTLIIICLYLIYFSQKIPSMGNHLPYIILFYCSCLYISGIALIVSVLVLWLAKNNHRTGVPYVIKRFVITPCERFIFFTSYSQDSTIMSQRMPAEEMRDHQVTEFDEHQNSEEHQIIHTRINKVSMQQYDWIKLACIVDRLAFIFLGSLLIILMFVYL